MPVTWDTLEGAGTSVVELEIRTHNEILDGAGDEHSLGPARALSRAPMCTLTDIVGSPFDFSGVKASAHLDAQRFDGPLYVSSGPSSASRPVKVASKPVSDFRPPLSHRFAEPWAN